ncbi:MAG: tetratricopeptide repeat protein, partial [Candidatus Eremiobacterota bacterium]
MPIFCDKCGFQNSNSARYCKSCGEDIIATGASGALMTGVILDERYEIKRLIKSGGMGSVYEALDNRFDKTPCAVKEMLNFSASPQNQQYLIDRFSKEARILNNLRHPNLPVVKDYFVQCGRYYLVMDYIEGEDLETVMKTYKGKGVPQEYVITWAIEILDALNYLHNQSPPVIYRDLKPPNIMIRRSDRRAMLIDFGIARTLDAEGQNTMTIVGTPVFAPEELIAGRPEPRTDLYSLGATMHCLLTSTVPQRPFEFPSLKEFNMNVSQELEDIIMCSLSRKPADRYVNAKQMQYALEKLSSSGQVPQTVIPAMPGTVVSVTPGTVVSVTPGTVVSSTSGTVVSSTPGISSTRGISSTPGTVVSATPQNIPVSSSIEKTVTGIREPAFIGRTITSTGPSVRAKGFNIKIILIIAVVIIAGIILYYNFTSDLSGKAMSLYKEGKYEEAIKYYNKILAGDEKNFDALNKKGECFSALKKYDEAVKCFDEALNIDKSSVLLWNNKGDALFEEQKYEESMECFDKVLEIDPGNSYAKDRKNIVLKSLCKDWNDRGTSLLEEKKYEEAIKWFDKTLKASPEDGEAKEKKDLALKRMDENGTSPGDEAQRKAEEWNDKGRSFLKEK